MSKGLHEAIPAPSLINDLVAAPPSKTQRQVVNNHQIILYATPGIIIVHEGCNS